MARAPKGPKQVATLTHEEARLNMPTAEQQSFAPPIEEIHGPVPPLEVARARQAEFGRLVDQVVSEKVPVSA